MKPPLLAPLLAPVLVSHVLRPYVQRAAIVFDAIDPSFAVFDGLPRVRAWRRALAARPSVQQAAADHGARLLDFIARRGSALSARVR